MIEIIIYIIQGIFQILMWTWWLIAAIIALMAWQNLRRSRWIDDHNNIVLSVKVPKNNEKGPTAAEMMFASLHGILKSNKDLKKEGSVQEHIGFEIVSETNSITFYVWVPKHLQDFVEGQIYAQYPTAVVVEVKDYTGEIENEKENEVYVAGTELKLIKQDYYPIKTFVNFDVDPLAGITGALSKIEGEGEKVWIQILVRPISDKWRNKGISYADSIKSGGHSTTYSGKGMLHSLLNVPLVLLRDLVEAIIPMPEGTEKSMSATKTSSSTDTSLTGIEEKANKLGYQVKIRVLYVAKNKDTVKERVRMAVGAFKQFNTTNLNGFTSSKISSGQNVLNEYRARLFIDKGFVLNIEEIASLYHLPHVSVETPSIVWTSSKTGEPPANLPYADTTTQKDELTSFAETTFRGRPKTFGIKRDDRRRHMYIIGKSGVGKSKLIELLAIADIKRGEGVAVVDPHGETITEIINNIPKERINDVVYFNPADRDFPVGFNPLETTPELREETASGFISVFKRLFGYSWGPRLEYVLRYTVLALTYDPDANMLGVVRMLTDKNYRKKVVSMVDDPVVKTFWLKEFTTYNDRFATEAVAPILNKVGQFTASPIIRNIVGQTKSTVDFKDAMNNQKILLVDLSTGKIGEDNSKLLGSMVITRLQLAAMTRAKIKAEERKDFYLYVDEFQNFATESFATILSEARKYRLALTLANQFIAQMEEPVRDAVFGNVGTLISFRVGATDAAFLEKEFTPAFDQTDLVNLDNQNIYLRMLIDGVTSQPFSAKTLMKPDSTSDNTETIVKISRERYGTPKNIVEEKIARWLAVDSIDVDEKIGNQAPSKFEYSNEQIERGEFPDKRKRYPDHPGGSPRTNTSHNTQVTKHKVTQTAPHQTSRTQNNPQTSPHASQGRVQTKEVHGRYEVKHPPLKQEMVPMASLIKPEDIKKIIDNIITPKKTSPVGESESPVRPESPALKRYKAEKHIEIRKTTVARPTSENAKTDERGIKKFPVFGPQDNIRTVSRDEFLGLKEIHPNEQIVIEDHDLPSLKETPPVSAPNELKTTPSKTEPKEPEDNLKKDQNTQTVKPGETIYFKK